MDNDQKEDGRPRATESESPGVTLDAHRRGIMKTKETLGSPRKKRTSSKCSPKPESLLLLEHQQSALPVSKECA